MILVFIKTVLLVLFLRVFCFWVIVVIREFLKLYRNSGISRKKSRGGVLSVVEKLEDRCIFCERVFVENIIAKFKVFKILVNKYRNRRKRYELCAALICGIINYENRK
jgi:hypothetical protein